MPSPCKQRIFIVGFGVFKNSVKQQQAATRFKIGNETVEVSERPSGVPPHCIMFVQTDADPKKLIRVQKS